MLVTLLLLFTFCSQVSCDWVEISQQHYFKPARATREYPQISVIKSAERTQANRVYVNNSLSFPNLNKGAVYKVPNSDVKRLIDSKPIRSKPINFEEDKSAIDMKKIFVGPTKLTREVLKRPTEENKRYTGHVYYNKDNVRRITFTSTEEPFKPLEVLNLFDLTYDDDEFPTIEIDNKAFRFEQLEHTEHFTTVIPTEDKAEHAEETLPNTLQIHSKNYDLKSFSTKAPSKKDFKVITKFTDTKPSAVNSADHILPKSHKKEKNDDLNLKPVKDSKSKDTNNVEILKEKFSQNFNTSHSKQIKQVTPKHSNKTSSNSQTAKTTKNDKIIENYKLTDSNKLNPIQKLGSEKPTHAKPMFENNVLRIDDIPKRSKIRNPEEVMLEEILHESDENFEDNVHKTSYSGTVNKVSDKSPITKVALKPIIQEQNNVSFKPIESQIQSTSVKHVATVNDIENTVTASSKIGESKEIEAGQLNSGTLRPVNTEKNLFVSNETDNHAHEERLESATNKESDQISEQQNRNDELTSTNSYQETTTIVKPRLSEASDASVKVHLITKASPKQEIEKTTEGKLGSEKIDSKKPPAVKKNNQENAETLANDTAADTLGTLVKVLKLVTETISRNTRNTLRGKMRYLEELRDTIMASIEQRLEAAFPDDAATPRRARSAHTRARGHVEFPSSESALMTISFLTFAVFLIKLVLQVIHALKTKAMVMPAVVATVGRAYHQYSNED